MTNESILHMPERRWAPSPYALGQLLTGKPIDDSAALKWIGKTFATTGELLFAPDPRRPTLLDLMMNPRFKPRIFESVDAVLSAAIADWAPDDAAVRAELHQMADAIRAAVTPERMALVTALLLPPEADLLGAPGAAGGAAGGGFQYVDYGDERIGGRFLVDPVSFLDPKQMCWNDCYLIAALTALAWVDPSGMTQRLQASVRHAPQAPKRFHAWTPFDPVAGTPAAPVEADGELPFTNQLERMCADSTQSGEFWPAMMEKIYLLAITSPSTDLAPGGPSRQRYKKLDFGWPHKACARLVGGRIGRAEKDLAGTLRNGDPITRQPLLDAGGKTIVPTMAWTLNDKSEDADERKRYKNLQDKYVKNFIIANHAYAVLGRMEVDGAAFVVLREPRCDQVPQPRPANYANAAAWKLPAGTQPIAEVPLNDKGVLALREDVFAQLFAGIGWMIPASGQ